MNIVSQTKAIMLAVGASPVMYLLVGLSVVSLGIAFERAWFFHSIKDNLEKLSAKVSDRLLADDLAAVQEILAESPSVEAKVVLAGAKQARRGADTAEETMAAATALQRVRMDRRLAFLGTVGNNAPFIGLFGTVVGIVQAFEALGRAGGMSGSSSNAAAPAAVMSSISEALVATAIGLLVAIPAVAAYNYFQRRIKSTTASTEALSRLLLAHLKATPMAAPQSIPRAPRSISDTQRTRLTGLTLSRQV